MPESRAEIVPRQKLCLMGITHSKEVKTNMKDLKGLTQVVHGFSVSACI